MALNMFQIGLVNVTKNREFYISLRFYNVYLEYIIVTDKIRLPDILIKNRNPLSKGVLIVNMGY